MAWTRGCRAYSVIGWMRQVAKLNIEHYKRLLASETDEAKRELIARLLAAEEVKLAKISEKQKRLI